MIIAAVSAGLILAFFLAYMVREQFRHWLRWQKRDQCERKNTSTWVLCLPNSASKHRQFGLANEGW